MMIKLANVLTACLAIPLVKVDPTYSAKAYATITDGGFTSNADNFTVKFGTDQNSNNSNYQLNSQRAGYLGYGGRYMPHTIYVLMDHRLAVFVPDYLTLLQREALVTILVLKRTRVPL